jgi:hypothetical protein
MHNVNLAEFEQTIDKAHNDPGALRQPVEQVTCSPAVKVHVLPPWR